MTQDKAHVIVRRATRLRADGSPIEVVSAFYAAPVGSFSPFPTSLFRSGRSGMAIETMLGCCMPSRNSDSR